MMVYKPFPGERMRKPVYLAVLGMSVVVDAVSLGVTLTGYLGLRAYTPKAAARAAPAPAERAVPATPPDQWTNLFAPAQGMELASRLSAGSGKGEPQAARTSFLLVGTIVSPNPATRRAILWADGMKQPKAFRENEEVEPGARLSSIERDKVWITRGKEREKLDLLPVGSRSRPTTAAAPSAPQAASTQASASPPAGDIRVTRLADNRYSIDEAGVAQISGNFNQFMTQVRLIPYFEGNKSAGYRIAAIFQNLKDEKKVSVNILRQGQKNTLTYEIR